MRTDAIIRKEFDFLEKLYGFKVFIKHYGPCYYIIWANAKKRIMVIYDYQVEAPVTIRVYYSDSLGFEAIEYHDEFALNGGNEQERIHYAAEWLRTRWDGSAM